jgi:hypothetical protein
MDKGLMIQNDPKVADLLKFVFYAGEHPHEDGWIMRFKFPNGLCATVGYGPQTIGTEVSVMAGDQLIEICTDMDGDSVKEKLFEIMERRGGSDHSVSDAFQDGEQ